MGIQAGAGGGHQVGGDILPAHTGIGRQKLLDISLYPLRQGGIGGGIVVAAGSKTGKLAAIKIEAVALLILIIGIVMVGRRTALHKIRLRKVLAHVGSTYRFPVRCHQAALGLTGENNRRQTAEHHGEPKAAQQQQKQRHDHGLANPVHRSLLICIVHDRNLLRQGQREAGQ